MKSRNGSNSKNQHAFLALLRAMKGNGASSTQTEGVERLEKLTKAFLHALDTSMDKRARALLNKLSKEVYSAFVQD